MSTASSRELTDHAHHVEGQIREGTRAIKRAWVHLAAYLYEFKQERMWELLGHDSFDAWVASPEIEIERAQARSLERIHREFVLERQVAVERLEGIDTRKLQMALPALKAGTVDVDEVLSDGQILGRRDMAVKYRNGGDPHAALDADGEPVRARCPTCRSWVDAEALES